MTGNFHAGGNDDADCPLCRQLGAEADTVSAFIFLLREEQEALKTGNADALPAIVERKNKVAASLAAQATARNTELARVGCSGDRKGMIEWLSRQPADSDAHASWQRLLALAEEAQELNRLNGELIRLRMSHNAQLLETLLAANRQDFYSADGQASSSTTRRIIDSA